MNSLFRSNLVVGYLLFIVIVAVYFPVLHHDFVNYKDGELIQDLSLNQNNLVYGFSQIDYAPAAYGVFQAEYRIGGRGFFIYRAVSLLIHVMNSILVFLLLVQLFHSRIFGLCITLIFALHPVQLGTISFIHQQQGMMSLFFLLALLMSYLSYLRSPGKYSYARVIGSGVLLLLFSGPLLYPVILLPALRKFEKKENLFTKDISIIIGVWCACLLAGMAARHTQWDIVLFLDRNVTMIRLGVIEGVLKLLIPFNISILSHWTWYSNHSFNYSGIIYPFVLSVITALLYSVRKEYSAAFYAWVLFIMMRLPVVTSTGLPVDYTFDSMLYPSSIILFTGIFSFEKTMHRIIHDDKIITIVEYSLACAFLAVFIVFSYANEKYWANSETLWNRALAEEPDNIFALNRRGMYYYDRVNIDFALQDFGTAVRLKPNDIESNMNYGLANLANWNLDRAIANFETVLHIQPKNALAYFNLGITYNEYMKYDSSIAAFDKAIEYHPGFFQAFNNRGIVYAKIGNYVSAYRDYDISLIINPRYAGALKNRALLDLQVGNSTQALVDYEKVSQLAPKAIDIKIQYGMTALLNGDTALAKENFTAAKQLDSANAPSYFNNFSKYFFKTPKQVKRAHEFFNSVQ